MEDLPDIIYLGMPDEKANPRINGQVSGWGHWTDSYQNCQGELVSPLLTTTFIVVGSNGNSCREVRTHRFAMDKSIFCASKNVVVMDFPLVSIK